MSETELSANCDLANREKAATDLLVTMGIIEGDHKPIVRALNMRWNADIQGVRVTVRPLELEASSNA